MVMLYDGRPDAGQKSDAYVTSHAAQDFDRTYLSTLLLPRIISSSLQAHLPTSALSLPHTHVSSLSKHGTDSSAWLSFDELRTAPYLALGVARCAACCSAFTLAWSWCHGGRCGQLLPLLRGRSSARVALASSPSTKAKLLLLPVPGAMPRAPPAPKLAEEEVGEGEERMQIFFLMLQ
jgi:hypothetical protein